MATTTRLGGACLAAIVALFGSARPLVGDTMGSDDRQANALLQQGRMEEATAMLHETLAAQPADARSFAPAIQTEC